MNQTAKKTVLRYRNITSGIRALIGIASRRYVFCGPRSVALAITDVCNTDCLFCWSHSPHVRKTRRGQHTERNPSRPLFMDPALFETIVRESRAMGAFRVVICGEGEPTLHPQFDQMLDFVTRSKMEPYVITNGLGVGERRAKIWATKRAHFRFSIHGGDQETWLKVHPSSSAKQFEGLSKVIRSLVSTGVPRVSTMHVIHKANFRHVYEMVEQARELGVKEILFRPARTGGDEALDGVTLNPEEEKQLHRELRRCLSLSKSYGIHTNLEEYLETSLHIRSGVIQTRHIYQKIPCYIGWIYGEFDIDGIMVPCLNSQRIMGRAGRERISDIWHSDRYWVFRNESRNMPKLGELVEGCICEACVMVKYNLNIYNLLHFKSMNYSDA